MATFAGKCDGFGFGSKMDGSNVHALRRHTHTHTDCTEV